LWRAMQGHQDILYRVSGIEREIFDAWTRTPYLEPSYDAALVGFVHADRLMKIRDAITSRPRISQENIIELGRSIAVEDRRLRQLFVESQKSSRKAGRRATAHQEDSNATMMAENAAKRARDPGTLKEMKKELDVAIARLDNAEDEHDISAQFLQATKSFEIPSSLLATSLLGNTRLRSTTSAKLNYIINEVSTTLNLSS
jgi:hypothetical protein